MTLRAKTVALFCAGTAGLLAVLFLIASTVWRSSLSAIEEDRVREDARRALSLLQSDVRHMTETARDWAEWDDTYEFLEDGGEGYVRANLTPDAFAKLRLDGMAFVRADGRVVWSGGFDGDTADPRPFPAELLAAPLAHGAPAAGGVHGFAAVGNGVALVSAQPVHPSVGPAPSRGRLVLYRMLDANGLAWLRERSRMTLRIAGPGDPEFEDAMARAATGAAAADLAADGIAADVPIEGLDGRPVAVLRVVEQRKLRHEGTRTLLLLAAGLAAAGVVFGGLTLWLLERHVLARLGRLSDRVRTLEPTGNLPRRVAAEGGDEIAAMADAVNSLLTKMEELQRARDASEAQLRDNELRLRQSEKLEAVGRLAGGVAHDFNNALVVVVGYADMLEARLRNDPVALRHIAEIRGAADRATTLTRQLLAFGRRHATQPRVFDLDVFLAASEDMLGHLVGADVELVRRCAPGLDAVRMDPDLLTQVLLTLAANARDAMPRGGRFAIDARNCDLAAAEDGVPAGRWVRIAFSDDGSGMDAETAAHAFEPFFTTKGSTTRTDLGLASVEAIVAQAGGHVRLESAPGRGTTVTVHLPSAGAAAPPDDDGAPDPLRSRDGSATGDGECVLLVDDEPAVRAVTSDALTRRGFAVTEAAGPLEALALAADTGRAIDCLVTDVVMPKMKGRELANRILAVRPGVPVVFVSGYPDDPEVRAAIEAGASFVQKPFTSDVLAHAVRRAIDRSVSRSA